MCIDPQHLGSEEESGIEIGQDDGNFEGLNMGSFGWYTQYRDI